jgi:hypothetical protein
MEIPRNEKICEDNAKISGLVREKTHTTQHDRTGKK